MARRTHPKPCELAVWDGEPGPVEDRYAHSGGALHESFARPETSDKLRSTDGLYDNWGNAPAETRHL